MSVYATTPHRESPFIPLYSTNSLFMGSCEAAKISSIGRDGGHRIVPNLWAIGQPMISYHRANISRARKDGAHPNVVLILLT